MADTVTIRSPQGQERQVAKTAIPFFTNQGYVVLDKAGRVNKAASSADTKKEND